MATKTLNPIAGDGRAAHREGWVDALRIVACAMVVLSHCCDHFTAAFDSNYTFFITGTAIGSLVRPCVP
ncbi:MAG: acyltransferase, partial [Muribaculaceae bacterium]|nr:acyltransferase [Muribaculaceae bacterium]